jgi:hypothetical protein
MPDLWTLRSAGAPRDADRKQPRLPLERLFMRISCAINDRSNSGNLRPFCTSVKVGKVRYGGPLIHATSLEKARRFARTNGVQPLSVMGELGFETDGDNVLIAAFRAGDHVTIEDIECFLQVHRGSAEFKAKVKAENAARRKATG